MKSHAKTMLFPLLFIIVVFVAIVGYKRYKQDAEYNSTEWYEVTAVYEKSETRQESVKDTYRDVNKKWKTTKSIKTVYDYYYAYTANDGETYYYKDKSNQSDQTNENATVNILVDVNDGSHNMKYVSKEAHAFGVKTTVLICIAVVVLIVIRKTIVSKVMDQANKII